MSVLATAAPEAESGPDVVQLAAELRPLIEANADEAERQRHQVPEVAAAAAEAGLHRVAVPTVHGGLGCDPRTMMRVIEEVSAADGAAGWTLMIGVEVLGVASGYLPAEVIAGILAAEPATIMAGAANPVGRAVPVQGGHRVSGRWPFASGIHNADWWWGGALIDDGSARRPRRFVQALIPTDEVTIVDTWDVAGLAGSGSHDVETAEVFVDHDHLTDLSSTPNVDDPLFRMPLMARFAFNKVGVATGIARAALTAFVELATAKTARGDRESLANRPRAQLAIADAEATLSSGRAWAFEVVDELWADACAGIPISAELHARVRLSCSHAVQSAVRAVEVVHSAAGSSVNFRSCPLERQFRDVHVVPQQITVAPHLQEAAGRVLLGLDPGTSTF